MLQPRDALRAAEGADEAAEGESAPTAGRRPRFEMRAEAKKAVRASHAKLGLATTQGAIEGIKMYAATHAAKEGEFGCEGTREHRRPSARYAS